MIMARNQQTTRRSPQQQQQSNRGRRDDRGGNDNGGSRSSGPNLLTALLSVASGIGIGAGVMYLLDPKSGEERREYLAEKASDFAHDAWDTVSEHAADASSTIAATAPKILNKVRNAGDTAEDARRAAGSATSGFLSSAGSYLPDFSDVRGKVSSMIPFQRRRSNAAPIAAATGASLAALAIGASAMWLFDPDRGRGRRAWIGQKFSRAANETGQFMRATGRHLANKSKGAYYETRSAAQNAMDSTVSHLQSGGSQQATGSGSQWAPTPAQDPTVPSI